MYYIMSVFITHSAINLTNIFNFPRTTDTSTCTVNLDTKQLYSLNRQK